MTIQPTVKSFTTVVPYSWKLCASSHSVSNEQCLNLDGCTKSRTSVNSMESHAIP